MENFPFKIICKLFNNSWPIVNKTVILKRNAVIAYYKFIFMNPNAY